MISFVWVMESFMVSNIYKKEEIVVGCEYKGPLLTLATVGCCWQELGWIPQ